MRIFSECSSERERRFLQSLDHGLSSRGVDNLYPPLNDIHSTVNWLPIDWLDENSEIVTLQNVEQESPPDTPHQEYHVHGESE